MLQRVISFCFTLLLTGAFAIGCTPEPEFHTSANPRRVGGESSGQIPLGQPDTFAEVEEEGTPEDTSDPATDEGTATQTECTPSLLVDCGT